MSALFDDEVAGWDGALQSVYSDHFLAKDGITLVGVYSPVNILSAAFPGVAGNYRRLVREIPRLAIFGGMIHDDGGGSVHRWLSREPLVTYKMIQRDKARLMRGIQILAKMAFAAGAREVMLPIFGTESFTKERDLDFLTERPPPRVAWSAWRFTRSARPRWGSIRTRGVVKPTGETWHVDNLVVADGSVLPTSIGVNSQLPVMAVATKIARGICADWSRYVRRAA